MTATPPEWLQLAGPPVMSTLFTVALFWQPQWIHRLFAQLASFTGRAFTATRRRPPVIDVQCKTAGNVANSPLVSLAIRKIAKP